MDSCKNCLDTSGTPLAVFSLKFQTIFANTTLLDLLPQGKREIIGWTLWNLLSLYRDTLSLKTVVSVDDGYMVYFEIKPKAEIDMNAMIAHQLRAPLTTIKWLAESLSEEKLTASQKEQIQDIYWSADSGARLIEDISIFGKIESGRLQARKQKLDLKTLIDRTQKRFIPIAKHEGKEIVADFQCDNCEATADQMFFENALGNLVDNAISYSDAGSKIVITLRQNPSMPQKIVSVRNTGSFIGEDDRAKIFSKFFRAESAQKIRPSGSGLGLHIVKILVEVNGGSIWFESDRIVGTTFYFTIPEL